QVTVTATDKSGNTSSTTVTVKVVEKEEEKDTEAPVLTPKEGVTVFVGDSLNASDLVNVSDNKDPNPVLTIGEYNTSNAGNIQVTVKVVEKEKPEEQKPEQKPENRNQSKNQRTKTRA
ncbi:adhesin, partial [Bacillus sp. JJ864]